MSPSISLVLAAAAGGLRSILLLLLRQVTVSVCGKVSPTATLTAFRAHPECRVAGLAILHPLPPWREGSRGNQGSVFLLTCDQSMYTCLTILLIEIDRISSIKPTACDYHFTHIELPMSNTFEATKHCSYEMQT